MAFVVFTTEEYELDRRELADALVVGRAAECDVAIRDILLSRSHCRIEKTGDGGWRIVDLGSKNGTLIDGAPVQEHTLTDGERVKIGRTTMTFFTRAFEPAPPGTPMRTLVRPSDPVDALAGTVAGFEYTEPPRTTKSAENFPNPKPRPREPAAYESEDLYTLLTEIASSSWDSIVADASRQKKLADGRELPRPMVRHERLPDRLGMPCDLSLQVDESIAIMAAQSQTAARMSTMQIALSVITMMLAAAVFGMSAWIVAHPNF